MEFLKAFGVDWRVLIAQFLNFAILLFILWKFGYKPIFKFLEERSKKIEEGIENAALAEDRIKQLSVQEAETMKAAKKEAADILAEARIQGEEGRRRLLDKAREEIGALINQEKESMRLEKAEVLKSIKKETAELVAASLEKILEEKLDAVKDGEVIRKSLAKLK